MKLGRIKYRVKDFSKPTEALSSRQSERDSDFDYCDLPS